CSGFLAAGTLFGREIQQSLSFLMQGRTVLAVAHRLSTLTSMDRILVFEHGKLIEHGSHLELMHTDGRYAQLWNLQSKP
ncbi:MAG: metal ABC transporter permease, partial [Rhabdochlamydiaceae bacterium]